MNDRASQVPPSPYLDEDLVDQQGRDGRKIITPRKLMRHANASEADRSETSRHSSIFKFGKTIAANLNPSNWKLWSKAPQPVIYDEELEQQRILDERAVKARRLYKELKESGHFPLTNATLSAFQDEDNERNNDRGRQRNKHDSGISFVDKATAESFQRESSVSDTRGRSLRRSAETPMDQKRMGRVYLDPNYPNVTRDVSRGPSPAISNYSEQRGASAQGSVSRRRGTSVRRSGSAQRSESIVRAESAVPQSDKKQGFSLRRASFTNIKNAFKGESTASLVGGGNPQARKMPSRADLQKQQKLVKRVSDLEGKLEAARRQLTESLAEPLPLAPPIRSIGHSRFVPGALATLPSERLLAGYVEPEEDDEQSEIGRAYSVDDQHTAPNSATFQSQDSILQDSLLQSVEMEDTFEDYPEAASTPKPRMLSEAASTPKQRIPSDVKLKEEPTPTAEAPKKLSPKGRKRKSAFLGLADDDGLYKPGKESESETGSELSKPGRGGLRKKPAGPPKKLRLATQKAPATKEPTKKSSVIGSRVTKKRGARQSVSPPAKTVESEYNMSNPLNKKSSLNLAGDYQNDEEEDEETEMMDEDIPPMPKMPKSIKLANGEIIHPTPTAIKKGKEGIVKMAEKKQGLTRAAESFEWPADVF